MTLTVKLISLNHGCHTNVGDSSSPVRHFSLEDEHFTNMYSPQFSELFREEQSPVEEIVEIQVPVKQKKSGRRRQMAPKKMPHKEKAVDQHFIPWTPEEETALCKGWVRISEDSVKGNIRKDMGFWIEILKYMHETCPLTQHRTYDMVNGK
ncbi:hypothetical protein Tco_0867710 [Tanacetum coccineum]